MDAAREARPGRPGKRKGGGGAWARSRKWRAGSARGGRAGAQVSRTPPHLPRPWLGAAGSFYAVLRGPALSALARVGPTWRRGIGRVALGDNARRSPDAGAGAGGGQGREPGAGSRRPRSQPGCPGPGRRPAKPRALCAPRRDVGVYPSPATAWPGEPWGPRPSGITKGCDAGQSRPSTRIQGRGRGVSGAAFESI